MTTIICTDCGHIVLCYDAHYGNCTHCGAQYEIEIKQLKKSPLAPEELKERQNRHLG